MKRVYKILRALLMTVIVLAVIIPAAIYVVMSSGWASDRLCDIGEKELSKALGTEVSIGDIRFYPFDKVVIRQIVIKDDYGEKAVEAKRLEARFELWHLLLRRHIVIDYVLLDNADINIYKNSKTSPLNIADILLKLQKKNPEEKPKHFDLSIYTIRLRDSQLSYNVSDEPVISDVFDPSHICLTGIDLLATAPKIENEQISGKIRHFRFDTNSGLDLKSLSGRFVYEPDLLKLIDLVVELPNSYIALGSYDLTLKNPEFIPLHILEGSYLTLSDLAPLVPKLSDFEERIEIEAEILASKNEAKVSYFSLASQNSDFILNCKGDVKNFDDIHSIDLEGVDISLNSHRKFVENVISRLDIASFDRYLNAIPLDFNLSVKANGSINSLKSDINLISSSGNIKANVLSEVLSNNERRLFGDITLNRLSVTGVKGLPQISNATVSLKPDITFKNKKFLSGRAAIMNGSAEVDHHRITLQELNASFGRDENFAGNVNGTFDGADIKASFKGNAAINQKNIAGHLSIKDFNPSKSGFIHTYEGYKLSFTTEFDVAQTAEGKPSGFLNVENLKFKTDNNSDKDLSMNLLSITMDTSSHPNEVNVAGDFINGTIYGNINPKSIVNEAKQLVANIMPELMGETRRNAIKKNYNPNFTNDFDFNFTIDNVHQLTDFFNLPVAVIYPVTIDGSMNSEKEMLTVGIDAPYLMKGDKIIEQTSVEAILKEDGQGTVYITTQMPTPKGMMGVAAAVKAYNDILSTEIDWEIERDKHLDGKIMFDTRFKRIEGSDALTVEVDFIPSYLRFGNDNWTISPAKILYRPGFLEVDNFSLATENQSIRIDGKCDSEHPDERIILSLDHLVLNSIFETLDINKVLVSGRATGKIFVHGLFSDNLAMYSNEIRVEEIGYNYCTLGTGFLKAKWDNARKGFNLDLWVLQEDGRKSYVDATVIPGTEELDVNITADNIKAAFMQPFMSGFTTEIDGTVTGKVKVFGTFSNVDLAGDVYTENFGMKVKFTNTWYYAKGAVTLQPGLLTVTDIPIHDPDGHTALLNGYFKHRYFSDLEFGFNITEATDILALDVAPRKDPRWFGKVYGSGSVFIKGTPREIDIDVNMVSSPSSTFTYSLSSTYEASQYSFIQFRDKTPRPTTDTIMHQNILPEAVIAYRDKILQERMQQNPDLIYNIAIQADITPAAKVTIIMDPDDGDEINAWGHGNLRITYNSTSDELKMYGSYSIDHGDYGFTMQDLIYREFTINQGSSITFTGNPNHAVLDLQASYTVRGANLTDLDNSFKDDPELKRTNVPVNAVLIVKGDMTHPDLDFDLEFPTLTSDVYRKVRSIVSTEEMMNQQIIYLLALNKFYSPEYMTATRGNELFSVASSTISSRLSSMLGRLSENWSISPNLRSDRGDFSDVQFDVALSSNLLNNRLRLNGNFGYRDKSLNTTQFIGDFDLEYLINPSGTWRLKAYNRFNDQTYFLRTAKTTQGVGLMFQRDFDNIFGIFRRSRKKTATSDAIAPTSEDNKE